MKTPALLLTALLLAVTVTGCSEAEELAKSTASDAACSVARQAMDGAGDQAERAVEKIKADPQAAERELRALRDALSTLEKQVDGETEGQVTKARKALDRLVQQADAARKGTPVDDQTVRDAQDDLDTAVEDFSDIC